MSIRSSAVLAWCFLALASWTSPSTILAAELFGPAGSSIRVGRSPGVVAVADLDGDGIQDLVVSNFDDDSVHILRGDGLGGFDRMTGDVAVGAGPFSLAVADLDSDGDADLAVANTGGDSVSVLLGNGAGSFDRLLPDVPVAGDPMGVVAHDFNADGAADLAVTNRSGDSVVILLGEGDGGFGQLSEQIGVGNDPFSLTAGDFDSDGEIDLAVCNFAVGADSVSILLGDGHGGFRRTEPDLVVEGRPIASSVDDFDNDGIVDLAVVSLSGDTVSVLLGDGLGGFYAAAEPAAVGTRPFSVAGGDFNGDGAADLVVTNFLDNSVSILLNDGSGSLVRSPEIAVGADPRSVAVGDFDRNGAADLAISNFGDDSVHVFLGNGIGDFSRSVDLAGGVSPRSVIAGDLNGDELTDLAVGSFDDDTVRIYLGDGDGVFGSATVVPVGDGPRSIAMADFDSDGSQDLAVAQFNANSVSILLGTGSGAFESVADLGVGVGPRSIAAGYFNDDSAIDLAVANQSTNLLESTVSVLLGNGAGGFTRAPEVGVGGVDSEPFHLAVASFDGDEWADLAVTKPGADAVSILLGVGAGGFRRLPDVRVGSEPTSAAVADLDGDGEVDLAVANSDDASISILLGDGAGSFAGTGEVPTGEEPFSLVAGDFNADGAVDLAVGSLGDHLVAVLLGDGSGGFARTPTDVAVGLNPFSLAVAQIDADHVADLVVIKQSVGGGFDDSVGLLSNQLLRRADVNGSNRVNGFDIALLGRIWGLSSDDSKYRRNADVNLDGFVDGADLALVANRFGTQTRIVSPLRPVLQDPVSPSPGTITIQPVGSEGDLLELQVLVEDNGFAPCAAAEFVIELAPLDLDTNPAPVLEALRSYVPGSYLAGGSTEVYLVDANEPNEVRVSVTRINNENRVGQGSFPLLGLYLRAKRKGAARLSFAAAPGRTGPALLDAAGTEIASVNFAGESIVHVTSSTGAAPGQRIGLAPDSLDFGVVGPDAAPRHRNLVVTNFGFSELHVTDVNSNLAEFFPSSTGFSVPPSGYVELPVAFSPTTKGVFSGWLAIESDDPFRPVVRVPVLGRSGLSLGLAPSAIEFGPLTVGETKMRRLRLTNREQVPLLLTRLESSGVAFLPQATFVVLDPGETGTVEISFRPSMEGEIAGLLTIGFDAPGTKRVVVSLAGQGVQASSEAGVR